LIAFVLLTFGFTAYAENVEAPFMMSNAQGLLTATSVNPGAIIRYNLGISPIRPLQEARQSRNV
jgi:hypothetical protein